MHASDQKRRGKNKVMQRNEASSLTRQTKTHLVLVAVPVLQVESEDADDKDSRPFTTAAASERPIVDRYLRMRPGVGMDLVAI